MRNKNNYIPVFFRTQNGKEPVRIWIDSLNEREKRSVSADMLFVAKHFPNVPKRGMIRKISGQKDMWEIRIRLTNKINARILFLIYESKIVFLHAFIKKSRRTPQKDLDLANRRKQAYLTVTEATVYEE